MNFNRGMLMNIGFVAAHNQNSINNETQFDCFVFHDVDLIPEDDRNSYSCPEDLRPRQLAILIDIYNYTYGRKAWVNNIFNLAIPKMLYTYIHII